MLSFLLRYNLLLSRQFVGATRRKDIFHCWPFPPKYLQICLKYGISNVLPPLEPSHPTIKITTETVGLTCSHQQDQENVSFENKARDLIVPDKLIEDECNSYYEVLRAPCHDCLNSHLDDSCTLKDESNLSSDYTSNVDPVQVNQQSSSAQGSHLYVDQRINTVFHRRSGHKQIKRKGRQKKRSMVDILAKAKPRTLEDLYRIRCNSINLTNDIVDESSSGLMAHVEDIKDDDEANNDNWSSKKSRVLKIKFGGHISKSWNID